MISHNKIAASGNPRNADSFFLRQNIYNFVSVPMYSYYIAVCVKNPTKTL